MKNGKGGWLGEYIEVQFDNSTKYHCNISNEFGTILDKQVTISPELCKLKYLSWSYRGVINGKAAAALPTFSDALTLSQSGGTDYTRPFALPHLTISVITPLALFLLAL